MDGPIWSSLLETNTPVRGCVSSRHESVSNKFPSLILAHHHESLRPWLNLFTLQSRITAADRRKHSWNSAGNTKVKKVDGKIKNVSLWLIVKSNQSMELCAYLAIVKGYYKCNFDFKVGRAKAQGHSNLSPAVLWQDCSLPQDFLHRTFSQNNLDSTCWFNKCTMLLGWNHVNSGEFRIPTTCHLFQMFTSEPLAQPSLHLVF